MKKEQVFFPDDHGKLVVQTSLQFDRDNGKAAPRSFSLFLDGVNTDIRQYFDPKTGALNKAGYDTITEMLVQGLNINLQGAHQEGVIDSAAHLRFIIARLEQLFINAVQVSHPPLNTVDINEPLKA